MSYLGQAIDYSFVPTASTALGVDRERRAYAPDARYWDTTATWAQRAVNAFRASRGQPLIAVDGRAGPLTIAALTEAGPGLPAPSTSPANVRVTPRVLVSKTLATRLEALQRVADPAPTRSSGGSSITTPGSDASTATPPDDALLNEGSAGGGLIARYGILPWVVGGTALVGVGLYFLMGSGGSTRRVQANRRRVRRNSSKHTIRRSSVPLNYPCPACGKPDLGRDGHKSGCKLEKHSGSFSSFSIPKGKKRRVSRNVSRHPKRKKLWVWGWVGGGHNSVLASTKAEATRLAIQMGKPNTHRGGGMTVTLKPKNVRVAKPGEIARLDGGWWD